MLSLSCSSSSRILCFKAFVSEILYGLVYELGVFVKGFGGSCLTRVVLVYCTVRAHTVRVWHASQRLRERSGGAVHWLGGGGGDGVGSSSSLAAELVSRRVTRRADSRRTGANRAGACVSWSRSGTRSAAPPSAPLPQARPPHSDTARTHGEIIWSIDNILH